MSNQTPTEAPKKVDTKSEEKKAAIQASASANVKARLSRDLEKRTYIPKKGTGKFFHLAIEVPIYKGGKRVSESRTLPQDYKMTQKTLRNASRLGYAIGFDHDASAFFSKSENEILLDLMQEYVEKCDMEVLDHAFKHLCKEKNNLNLTFKKLHAQKEKYINDQQKAVKKKDSYLDRLK